MIDNTLDNEQYIIFASDESDEHTIDHLNACRISFKQLQGRYKGEDETSFIINKREHPLIEPLIENQESILELSKVQANGLRMAGLSFKHGLHTMLGNFIPVSESEAKNNDAYTYDPNTEIYYITK